MALALQELMDFSMRSLSPPDLALKLLGDFEMRIAGRHVSPPPGRREQSLLALLVLERGRPVRRAVLAQTLWPFPDYSADNAAFYLRRTLHALRKTLGAQARRLHASNSQTLALDIADAEIDLIRFEALAQSEDPTIRIQAVGCYGGPLLSGCTETWILSHRERLERLRLSLSDGALSPSPSRQEAKAAEAVSPGFLPCPLTPLIGRDGLLARLTEDLKQTRLLTLLGPGGTGKTRLAIALADAGRPAFTHGVWFVDLAAIGDGRALADAVADTLQVHARAGQEILPALEAFLASRHLLLVLDNCEHLHSECGDLAVRLLRGCQGLKIVATSRERLEVIGETVRRVPGLGYVDSESLLSDPRRRVRQVAASSAAQLFLRLAQSVQEDFHITTANAAEVARLCGLLDGLPLALELAAARIEEQPLSELLPRLEAGLSPLVFQAAGAPDRHRSLEACLRWSWERLSSAEQERLCQLSVFSGGWTLPAAQAVCRESEEIPSLLASLARKSLIVRDDTEAETRYRLLETVRQFARSRLPAEEEVSLRDRHLAYFLELAEHARDALYTAEHSRTLCLLDREIGNLRAALTWSLSQYPTEDSSDRYLAQGGIELLERAGDSVTMPSPMDRAEAGLRLVWSLGWYHQLRGRVSEIRRWLLIAFEATQGRCNGSLRGHVCDILGRHALAQGDTSQARDYFEQAVTLYREHGATTTTLAYALHDVSEAALEQEDYLGCRDWNARAQQLFPEAAGLFHIPLSQCELAAGNLALARQMLVGSLEDYRSDGVTSREIECLIRMSDIEIAAEDRRAAHRCIREALVLTRTTANMCWLARLLWRRAALKTKSSETSARLLGAADALMDWMGALWTPREWRMQQPFRAACRAALGETAFAKALSGGRSLSWAQAIDLALNRIAP